MAEWDILDNYVTMVGNEVRRIYACDVTAGINGDLILCIRSIEAMDRMLKKFKDNEKIAVKIYSWYFYYNIVKRERYGYHPKCPYMNQQCNGVRLFYFTITAKLDRVERFSEETSQFEDVSKDFQKGGNLTEGVRGKSAYKRQIQEEIRDEKITEQGGVDIYA